MKYNVDGAISVDTVTGETGQRVYERFLFLRSVDDYEWMDGLGVNGVKTLLFMVSEANKNGFLEFTPRVRRRILKKLDVKERMFYNIVKKLKDKELIKEIERGYYRIAPYTAYRFHSRKMSENIKEYLDI